MLAPLEDRREVMLCRERDDLLSGLDRDRASDNEEGAGPATLNFQGSLSHLCWQRGASENLTAGATN